MIISTSGRLSDSSPDALPVPAPRASKAWMYWLIRSASSPPVRVVSPRNSTGRSLCRLSAPTVRWPECRGWRSRSPDERSREEATAGVMRTRLERVPIAVTGSPPELHSTRLSLGIFRVECNSGAQKGRLLPGAVLLPLQLLLDPLVVLRELLGFGDAAHFEAGAAAQRALQRPLLGLLDRRHPQH